MYRFFEQRVNPYPSEAPRPLPKQFLAFIWQCTEGVRGYILALIAVTAVIGVFEALLFAMMGNIVDWLSHTPAADLWHKEGKKLILLGAVLLGSTFLILLQTLIKRQALAGNFPMRLRWNFHRLMLNQSMSFYQDEFAGRISAKVMQTALAVRDFCLIVSDILVFIVIYFSTMITVVGGFNSKMLVPFIAWLVIYVLALRFFIPRLSKVSRNQADARSLMSGRITDSYTNIATVKLFAHAGHEAEYARSAMQQFMHTVHHQMRMISHVEVANHFIGMLLTIGTAGMALWLWSIGEITVGAVAAATAMALRLNGIAHWIMWEMTSLFESIGTVQDGINTLTHPNDIVDADNANKLVVTQGEIRFDAVRFSYGSDHAIIDDLSLHIRPGEKIGLVGRSGAGKSTIVNLLLRFYDTEKGRITIDGQSVADVTQDSLRSQIGMVTQDTSLLHRSVRDNILYGKPNASEEEMIAAAKRAEAHSFILTLVDAQGRTGYDAHVGERGVKLSGGQRQRIAIARAMLKNAPILLLDEATSALDSEAEVAIQESLYRLMEGKTVIAIAHRLSTIAAMDKLIILDKGRIIEQGSHQDLLKQAGLYARLWSHQTGGFLPEEA
jgi:ATP-binding cassette subfamily B multidrug efflux pump